MHSEAHIARVQGFFDSVSARYLRKSSSALWRLIRWRERKTVFSLLPSLKGLNVLEACCGSGYYTRFLAEAGPAHLTAVDLSPGMVAQLARLSIPNVTVRQGDINEIAERVFSQRFDLILCAGGLEFMEEPSRFFKKAAALSQPHGQMVLLFPPRGIFGRGYRRFHRRNGLKIGLFSLGELTKMADQAGWVLRESSSAHPFAMVGKFEKRS